MSRFRRSCCLLGVILGALAADAAPASPAPVRNELEAYVALARSDIRQLKSTILAQNLILAPEEASEFWPLQRQYEAAATAISDRRVALVRQFIEQGGTYTDADAKKLAQQVFALERERTKLKETWFKKFLSVLPARKAARYFQIENQLNTLVDLQVAAELPLIH